MKLNHLILVICTGILVGFSACKKDPFTEKDAIEAQKELITLKAGYDLAIKNVELAIQKAADEARIAIVKLEIQGASDLSKQEAAQRIAYDLAVLQNQWRDLLFRDSVERAQAIKDAQTLSFVQSVLTRSGNPYLSGQWSVVENENGGTAYVPGATMRFIPADKSTYVTLTANAEGQIRYSNLLLFPNERMYLEKTNSAKKVYATTVYRASCIYDNSSVYIYSYDPTATFVASGTLRAAFNLTNNAEELVGAGQLVTAYSTFDSPASSTDSSFAEIEIPTVTLANSTYSLTLPDNVDNALGEHFIEYPVFVKGYQKAYTNWNDGDNQFQTLPSINDSLYVYLGIGLGSYVDVTNYYLTLPDEDGEGYSMTLTDPLKIIAKHVYENYGDDTRLPDGTTENTTNTLASGFSIDVDGFVLNNGWFKVQPSDNEGNQYVYDVPQIITPDSSAIKYYTDTLTQTQRDSIWVLYLTDFVNTGGNPTQQVTPTVSFDTTYTVDTLAVELVDLSGFVAEAPELSASIDINGALESIFFEEDASTGLFNIEAALAASSNFTSWTAVLTNRERKASKISGEDTDQYLNIGKRTSNYSKSVYYGAYYSGAYNGYATSEKPLTDDDAYYPAGTWQSWDWTPSRP